MKKNKGFTLVELMMVMVVMAIIATLATGAAMKSIKQAKEKRIDSTCVALKMALVNYQAAELKWPMKLKLENDTTDTVEVSGENNKYVFEKLLTDPTKPYLDPSALLTKVDGKVMPLRVAMDTKSGRAPFPIGYADPSDGNIFRFFKVTFNVSLDTVSVAR